MFKECSNDPFMWERCGIDQRDCYIVLTNCLVFHLQAITVHDLNLQCTSTNPDLVIIFFRGIDYGKNDEWNMDIYNQ
jgi:hypothetical protein